MKHTMECLLCYLFGLAPKFQPMEESAKANEMRNPVYYSIYIYQTCSKDSRERKHGQTMIIKITKTANPKNKRFCPSKQFKNFSKKLIK